MLRQLNGLVFHTFGFSKMRWLFALLLAVSHGAEAFAAPQISFDTTASEEPISLRYACNPGIELTQKFGSIINTGDQDLIVSSIEVAGVDKENVSLSSPTEFPVTVPAGDTFEQSILLTCDPQRLDGPLQLNLVIKSNDPISASLVIPFVAAVESRPNLYVNINTLRGEFVKGKNPKFILSFSIENNGPLPTTQAFSVRVKIQGPLNFTRVKNIRVTQTMPYGTSVEQVLVFKGLPKKLRKFIAGTGIGAIGAPFSGSILVDAKREILESNEASDSGLVIDTANSDNSTSFSLK